MKIVHSPEEAHAACLQARREGKTVGLVPTMGALHEGHLSLVRTARAQTNFVVVSVFVNTLQFGPSEDFEKYPRTFEHDRDLLAAEGVALLFAPTTDSMYSPGASTFVQVDGITRTLEGERRPGHFRGVTTVVTKLFNVVTPDVAIFGQKDAQQAAVIRKMVRDLNMDIRILVAPIVREADGLAMSSRNRYLEPQQRKSATVLYRALTRMQSLADQGEHRADVLITAAKEVLSEEPGVRLDYLAIVDPDTFDSVPDVARGALALVAAYVGNTRLIDNLRLGSSGEARGPAFSDK